MLCRYGTSTEVAAALWVSSMSRCAQSELIQHARCFLWFALRPAASFLAHQMDMLLPLTMCMCMQGSHWSRKNRMFVMHDSRPQLLSTLVAPSDVMAFSGGDPSSRYVLYSDAQKTAWVTDLREGIKVTLKRAESDLVTVVPLHEVKGLSVAPIGAPLCGECCCCILSQAADFLPII